MRSCTFCKNHDEVVPKNGHKSECTFGRESHWQACLKCKKTRERQISVAKEKKLDYKLKSQVSSTCVLNDRERAVRVCRKCKRHGQNVVSNKKHDVDCPYKSCSCEACITTDTRREHVRIDLKQARTQTRRRRIESWTSNATTDSGFFSTECSADTPNPLMEFDAALDEKIFIIDVNNPVPTVPLIDSAESIQSAEDTSFDQYDDELASLFDLDFSWNNQEMQDISEFWNQPQSMQQILNDCGLGDSQTE